MCTLCPECLHPCIGFRLRRRSPGLPPSCHLSLRRDVSSSFIVLWTGTATLFSFCISRLLVGLVGSIIFISYHGGVVVLELPLRSRTTVALFVVGLLVQLGIQLDSVWFWFGLLCIHRVSVVFCRDRFLAFPVKFSAARHVAVRRRSRRRDFSLVALNRPSPLPLNFTTLCVTSASVETSNWPLKFVACVLRNFDGLARPARSLVLRGPGRRRLGQGEQGAG
jgi:hypothetical protein